MQVYKACWCVFHTRGRCTRGRTCSFAHTADELRQLPDLRKTKLCNVYFEGRCENNNACCYAHGLQELKEFPGKKGICKLYRGGKCSHGSKCKYAHSLEELQASFVHDPYQAKPSESDRHRQDGRGGRTGRVTGISSGVPPSCKIQESSSSDSENLRRLEGLVSDLLSTRVRDEDKACRSGVVEFDTRSDDSTTGILRFENLCGTPSDMGTPPFGPVISPGFPEVNRIRGGGFTPYCYENGSNNVAEFSLFSSSSSSSYNSAGVSNVSSSDGSTSFGGGRRGGCRFSILRERAVRLQASISSSEGSSLRSLQDSKCTKARPPPVRLVPTPSGTNHHPSLRAPNLQAMFPSLVTGCSEPASPLTTASPCSPVSTFTTPCSSTLVCGSRYQVVDEVLRGEESERMAENVDRRVEKNPTTTMTTTTTTTNRNPANSLPSRMLWVDMGDPRSLAVLRKQLLSVKRGDDLDSCIANMIKEWRNAAAVHLNHIDDTAF